MPIWTNALAPAWVQAIGSIAAVVAAAALIFIQHDLSNRAVSKQRRASIDALIDGLSDAVSYQFPVVYAGTVNNGPALVEQTIRCFDSYRSLLLSISNQTFDDQHVWRAIAELLSGLSASTVALENLADKLRSGTEVRSVASEIGTHLDHVRRSIEGAKYLMSDKWKAFVDENANGHARRYRRRVELQASIWRRGVLRKAQAVFRLGRQRWFSLL